MPFTVVQLTDPHVGARGTTTLLRILPPPWPLSVESWPHRLTRYSVSGDIASTPTDSEYEQARDLLGGLDAPLYVLPGDHDDRDVLSRHFDIPATDAHSSELCRGP